MALQPYIIVSDSSAAALAADVCNYMYQGYVPFGNPWSETIVSESVTGQNVTSGNKQTVTQNIRPLQTSRTFYQAMMLKINFEYEFLYHLYGPIY